METDLSLKNTENYKENLDANLTDIYISLKMLLHQYIKCCSEISENIDRKYLLKGFKIIFNVYKMILMYSKNLELTKLYTANSIYYYIEYINQIHNKDSEIIFVDLTLHDAILYVYRKSIYEVSDSYKKKFKLNEEENVIYNTINKLSLVYVSMYVHICEKCLQFIKYESLKIHMDKIDNLFEEYIFENKKLEYDNCNILNKIHDNFHIIFDYENKNELKENDYLDKIITSIKEY